MLEIVFGVFFNRKTVQPATSMANGSAPHSRDGSLNRCVSRDQSPFRGSPVTEAKFDLIEELKRSNGRACLKRAKPETDEKPTNGETINMNSQTERGRLTKRSTQPKKTLKVNYTLLST